MVIQFSTKKHAWGKIQLQTQGPNAILNGQVPNNHDTELMLDGDL